MRKFILLQLVQMVLTLIVLSAAIFGLVRLGGDPVLQFLPPEATQAEYQALRAQFGLDKPIYIQYWRFLAGVLEGDFGTSIFTKRPVIDSIKEMLPNSIRLVAVSTFVAFLIAIPLGVMAAAKKGTAVDTTARVVAGLGQSAPSFWIGLILIQLFAVQLRILPSSGMGSWRHYIMPSTCLAFFILAGPIRLLRSSMLEALDSEYIRLAKIKGVSPRSIVWKHALRNSLLPVVSFSAMYIASLVTGAILVETVFAWPGIGRLSYRAIINQDYPVIQGVVLTTALIVIAANFVADILYAYIDPRIRLE
jgi:peptide/nickel transport system permease protein